MPSDAKKIKIKKHKSRRFGNLSTIRVTESCFTLQCVSGENSDFVLPLPAGANAMYRERKDRHQRTCCQALEQALEPMWNSMCSNHSASSPSRYLHAMYRDEFDHVL